MNLMRWRRLVHGDQGDAADSYMVSEREHRLVVDLLHQMAVEALDGFPGRPSEREVIETFLALHRRRPIRDNTGGSGFHNLFWLWLILHRLEPDLVVESGVWKGQGTWLIRNARPTSEHLAFDIDLGTRVYRDPSVTYHECDWSAADVRSEQGRGLVFFDCHVDHGRRIREAHERGFEFVLLDDNPPSHLLSGYGRPPLPTAAMLLDEELSDGAQIEWIYRGQRIEHAHDGSSAADVREMVQLHHVLPDVAGPLRLGGHSFLTLAQLRR